jgi:hypothetical protein
MNESEEFADILGRLRELYRAELALAEADPPPPSRIGVRRRMQVPVVPVGVVAVAIVALVAVVATRPGPEFLAPGVSGGTPASTEDGQASPFISQAPSLQPKADATGEPAVTPGRGPTFPAEIDGEVVLVGSSVLERAASGSHETFLAAGWVVMVIADCYIDCGSGFLLRTPEPRAEFSVGLRLEDRPLDLHVGRAVVLSVHRDRFSPTCDDVDSCAVSVVIDDVVWLGPTWPGPADK